MTLLNYSEGEVLSAIRVCPWRLGQEYPEDGFSKKVTWKLRPERYGPLVEAGGAVQWRPVRGGTGSKAPHC